MNTESVKIFPDEETFRRIYSECLGNAPQAPEKIGKAYEAMQRALHEYINVFEEWTFRCAYQCGYEAAQKGGAVV